ncbi:MAG: citrate lyase holo-[acyl-carrier protein] synthase [Sulfurospirillum sp.]|nr:citrate lyase holo-[acyl-carrier protein] synthase [Sulfurospirillum sp.]
MIDQACPLSIILANKEERARRQKELLVRNSGCFLISLSINTPSAIKLSLASLVIYEIACQAIDSILTQNGFECLAVQEQKALSGAEKLFTCRGDARAFKILTCKLEVKHPLGRLMDIDVFDPTGVLLSRTDFGFEKRRCLLCENEAFVCAREQKHSYATLNASIKKLVWQYANEHYIALACELAMQTEVQLTPKPGLVDSNNSGAHSDMNIHTFYASIQAIKPFISSFLAAEPLDFATLRTIGIACEKAMLKATHGINTHKGMIFCLALFCGAIQQLQKRGEKLTCKHMQEQIKLLAKNLVKKDLIDQNQHSAGARYFAHSGHAGIRQYAQEGFMIVFAGSVPFFQKQSQYHEQSHALKLTMLWLMANLIDTTLYARGGDAALLYVQQKAKDLLTCKYKNEKELNAKLYEFDADLIAKNLSAGGSADLLALTWLASKLLEDETKN